MYDIMRSMERGMISSLEVWDKREGKISLLHGQY